MNDIVVGDLYRREYDGGRFDVSRVLAVEHRRVRVACVSSTRDGIRRGQVAWFDRVAFEKNWVKE